MAENKERLSGLIAKKSGGASIGLARVGIGVVLASLLVALAGGTRAGTDVTSSRSSWESSEKNMPASAASEKFAQLSDQFLKDSLALSPTNASAAGYHHHVDPKTGRTIVLDAQLDDMSLEAMATRRAFYAAWRERFRTETPPASLDRGDAADWQLIDDQIGLNLLEYDKIQAYRHHPTVPVELIGNAIFLPLSQSYAAKHVRLEAALDRIEQIPRLLNQVKQYLGDADPVFVQTAIQENDGNIDLIQTTVADEIKSEIDPNSHLKAQYDRVAPPAITALKAFSRWLRDDLGKRRSNQDWRLGKDLYDQKFKLVMETFITPEQVLSAAEDELKSVRAEMLQLALPMHAQMYPGHGDHSDLTGRERENRIIGEVLGKISDDHPVFALAPGEIGVVSVAGNTFCTVHGKHKLDVSTQTDLIAVFGRRENLFRSDEAQPHHELEFLIMRSFPAANVIRPAAYKVVRSQRDFGAIAGGATRSYCALRCELGSISDFISSATVVWMRWMPAIILLNRGLHEDRCASPRYCLTWLRRRGNLGLDSSAASRRTCLAA